MTATYRIHPDPARDFVSVALAGFFDVATVDEMADARAAPYALLRCPPNRHVTLVDVSGCQLQSQEVVAAFRRMLGNPRYASRRIAFVTGSSLARMQVRRIIGSDAMACFDTAAEAKAWLFGEAEQRAA